jgi:mRNA interferase RelE/StbE
VAIPVEYEVGFRPAARRQLASLPLNVRPRVSEAIDRLGQDPRPTGVTAMAGEAGRLRLRVGNYRVVYLVDDDARRVTIERVGHRGDVYR